MLWIYRNHLAKFHKMTDAKRCGMPLNPDLAENDESKEEAKLARKYAFGLCITSSTNDVSIAYNVSTPSGSKLTYEQTSIILHIAYQSSGPSRVHDDFRNSLMNMTLEERLEMAGGHGFR
ncbi:hypothetical protein Tco_1503369 [Tanacetum coccineum]